MTSRTMTHAAMTDRELVDAMRRDDRHAFAEFQLRFMPLLLAEARRARIASDVQAEIVTELLDDVILRLLTPGARVPQAMAAYLATTFRRRVINAARGAARRARVVRESSSDGADDGAVELGNVAALSSEGTRRASAGPIGEAAPTSPAVIHFADALGRDLSEEERRLLEWAASHVPQREIAAWLGIGYEAAGKRVRRLRARLIAEARARIAELDPAERAVVERLLRRAAPTDQRRRVFDERP